MNGLYQIPEPYNEPVLDYEPGSPERADIKSVLKRRLSEERSVPMFIGGDEVRRGALREVSSPHDHKHVLGRYTEGTKEDVSAAIEAALEAKKSWSHMPWDARASIFLKAASLLAGPYRQEINASTMLSQSKNIYQAEIDAACEFIDFLRFNARYMEEVYANQPDSSFDTWNRMEYRPLEGFVFAISPFNFTSIAGNLSCAPAMMGNTVVWKPATAQIYSAEVIMRVLVEAGLPPGVINLVYAKGSDFGEVVFKHPEFAGLHFTGSTKVFQELWGTIAQNLHLYRNYPRIVGETGGKDFVLAHKSASVKALATAILRGAFEYQGQKCSAVSRVYVPESVWKPLKPLLVEGIGRIKTGSVLDFRNFTNAVITEAAYKKITGYLEEAKADSGVEVFGGEFDDAVGYFVKPALLVVSDPKSTFMQEEIFGPVVSLYVYKDDDFDAALSLVNTTSPYALTGAVFAQDRLAVQQALKSLEYAAGNFYINDKPTGAVVGQQPFGGSRLSGTNDKAGASMNLLRWVSPRTIKENFNPPESIEYPFMKEE